MKRGIGGQKGETRNGALTPAEATGRKRLLDWLAGADLGKPGRLSHPREPLFHRQKQEQILQLPSVVTDHGEDPVHHRSSCQSGKGDRLLTCVWAGQALVDRTGETLRAAGASSLAALIASF